MSMNCYFTAVWGIGGTIEDDIDLDTLFPNFSEDDLYNEPEIVPGVKLLLGGDQCSGPQSWSLQNMSTRLYVDHRGENYPNGQIDVVNKLNEPTTVEKINFGLAMDKLEITNAGEPGWMLLKDVG